MKITQFLERLTKLEVRLFADGGLIRWKAPRGTVTPEIVTLIREHKPALLSLLAQSTLADAEISEDANEAALELAHERGFTTNGYAVEYDAGAAYRENDENQEAAA